jgi:TRAP transporter 4TM/12TM fusion protein
MGGPDPHDDSGDDAGDATAAPAAWRGVLLTGLAAALSLFVLIEVNFPLLPPLAELAVFGGLGLVLCFLSPASGGGDAAASGWRGVVAMALAVAAAICCGYLVVQSAELGRRAAVYTAADLAVGAVGLMLVLEAARRSIGWSLPVLAILFLLYAHESVARGLPDWLFPHRGQDWQAIIGQSWLRSEGVFGTALAVMFRYVFLFVLFGVALEAAGATGWVIGLAERLFGGRAGGPAKVAVLASGLMGSLSGSAVANAATTGTFTIPLMRGIGFSPAVAAGIEAAASSGGALVPPVMGAGAYMMLEIINRDPPVRFLEIVQAAIIPAILYYLSIFLLVHFYAGRLDADTSHDAAARPRPPGLPAAARPRPPGLPAAARPRPPGLPAAARPRPPVASIEGITFGGALGLLMMLLFTGWSPFRAVSLSLCFTVAMILLAPGSGPVASRATAAALWGVFAVAARLVAPGAVGWLDTPIIGLAGLLAVGLLTPTWGPRIASALRKTAAGGVPLVAAAACVGIVIGLVSRTGIGTGVPAAIIPLAGDSLFLALLAIMGCSLVLGMGLPSAVSYLLLATIIGPVFANDALGVPILAAHLFIFYFGMMAMVTPPVALAAYATASIAGASVMAASLAAFRFALVGFTLPFMFVYRPALCLMDHAGGRPTLAAVAGAVAAAIVGITALAAGMAGFLTARLSWPQRACCFVAAACALAPDQWGIAGTGFSLVDLTGLGLLLGVAIWSRRGGPKAEAGETTG